MLTDDEIDRMEAGPELDALVAELVMGWRPMQAPKWDYDGAVPEQGMVLVPPHIIGAVERCEYVWPPKGVIPFTFFLGHHDRFSTDIAAAWRAFDTMPRPDDAPPLLILSPTVMRIGDKSVAGFFYQDEAGGWHWWGKPTKAPIAPLSIVRAALKATRRAVQ